MTNVYSFDGILVFGLLFICTCAYLKKVPRLNSWLLSEKKGVWGVFYKESVHKDMDERDWCGGTSQSPDLNLIEHLWDELERRLRARPSRPTSMPDLTNALLEERSKIPINILLDLVESLPRRVEAVTAAKSGSTPYYIHVHVEADVPVLAWLTVSVLIHHKGVLSGLWTLLCALVCSHVGTGRGHPQTVPTKFRA
ncbi:protein kish-B isoform X1 [Hemibagrus wyckioides]|uniref:protein kish-B isoform X1 n=1 Tax=Hemibagrus wyckioides TaxID=337641 RepID=UPI00266BFB37|nr:protein kish-B isoform X1 [Hemibagrus wyckioides]